MCRAATNVDRVSSEWFSRPDDERYLSLDHLFASVKGRVGAEPDAHGGRAQRSGSRRIATTRRNWASSCRARTSPSRRRIGASGRSRALSVRPAAYLRQLPAPFAGINLQYGLTNHRAEQIKTMEVADGRTELRAVTGPRLRPHLRP